MWNTTVFITEMLGMVVLMLSVITSITVVKKYKLTGIASVSFGAVTVTLGLFVAILIGCYAGGPGYINPAAMILVSVAKGGSQWDLALPSLAGEMVGAFGVAVLFVLARLALKSCMGKESDYLFESFQSDTSFAKPGKTVIGEVVGSTIFFGAILAAVVMAGDMPQQTGTNTLTSLVVSLGLLAAIFATANLGSMLNPGVAFGLLVIKTVTTLGKGFKFDFANFSLGAASSLAMAGALGALGMAI